MSEPRFETESETYERRIKNLMEGNEILRSECDKLKEEVARLIGCWTEIDKMKAELEAMRALAIHHDSRAIRFGKDRDRWKTLAGKMAEYANHENLCILSFWEAGEPTEGGGYRTKYKGKWYQSKPINEEPKCDCGYGKVWISYQSAISESAKGESK